MEPDVTVGAAISQGKSCRSSPLKWLRERRSQSRVRAASDGQKNSQEPDDTTNSLDRHDHHCSSESDEGKTDCAVAASVVRAAKKVAKISDLIDMRGLRSEETHRIATRGGTRPRRKMDNPRQKQNTSRRGPAFATDDFE